MTNTRNPIDYFSEHERTDLTGMASWLRGIGIALLVAGLLAVLLPHIATWAVNIMVAAILLVSGVMHLAHAFSLRRWRTITWEGLTALVFLAAGLLFAVFPISGVLTLTLLLGGFFLVVGLLKSQAALAWRPRPGWGLMLTTGILSLILGMLVILGLPGTATWAIGLILGIDLFFTGLALTALGARLKHIGAQY